MKKIGVLLCFFICVASYCFSQSASKMEDIIGAETMTVGQACYLAGCANGQISDDASYKEAFQIFSSMKMFQKLEAGDTIRMDQFSNLAMQATGAKGGLWYRVSKSPHYAIRFLKKVGIVSRRFPPSKLVSGKDGMEIFYELSRNNTTSEVE